MIFHVFQGSKKVFSVRADSFQVTRTKPDYDKYLTYVFFMVTVTDKERWFRADITHEEHVAHYQSGKDFHVISESAWEKDAGVTK